MTVRALTLVDAGAIADRRARQLLIDFSRADSVRCREHVRRLIALGFCEAVVATWVGWDLNSVRAACGEHNAPAHE